MSPAPGKFHNQLAKNFIILTGLVIAGWFIYYDFAPSTYVVNVSNNQRAAVASPVETKKIIDNDGVYRNEKFRIRPPVGWAVGDAAALRVAAMFINPAEDKSKEKVLHSNISVITEPTSLTLDAYVKSSKETLQRLVKKYNLTEYQKTKVNGRSGYMMGGIFEQSDEQMRNRQLIILEGGMAYIVTGTALDSAWGKYVKQINAALASFDL